MHITEEPEVRARGPRHYHFRYIVAMCRCQRVRLLLVFPPRRGRVPGIPGMYCSGWARRGPSGIIGTNIADARSVVAAIVEDIRSAQTLDFRRYLSHVSLGKHCAGAVYLCRSGLLGSRRACNEEDLVPVWCTTSLAGKWQGYSNQPNIVRTTCYDRFEAGIHGATTMIWVSHISWVQLVDFFFLR